jgi:hypothetical protein
METRHFFDQLGYEQLHGRSSRKIMRTTRRRRRQRKSSSSSKKVSRNRPRWPKGFWVG